MTYVSFFITICYHTVYARPWIYPVLAFHAVDLHLRLLCYRIQDATLTCVKGVTIVCSCASLQDVRSLTCSQINIDGCDGGCISIHCTVLTFVEGEPLGERYATESLLLSETRRRGTGVSG